MLLLNISGLILLVIFILLAVLILIPYTYIINSDDIRSRIEISILWMFGKFKFTYGKNFDQKDDLIISLFKFSKKVSTSPHRESRQKKSKKNNSNNKKKIKWKNHINKPVINKLIILLSKILKSCKPDTIFTNLKIGFNDPMYTGLLYGLYNALSYEYNDRIQIQPVFDDEMFKGSFLVRGNVWVFYLIIIILEFLISSPIRNEIRLIIKERRVC